MSRQLPDGTTVYELDPAEVTAGQNAATLSDRADKAIATLENAYANRAAGAPPPAVLWLTVRVVIALARIVLNRTEAAP